MAKWAEERGFRTRIVERLFPGGIRVQGDEPLLALGGVDNPEARAAYEDAGFECVIEAGLGAGLTEYLAMRVHACPASTTARHKWGGAAGAPASATSTRHARAYTNLAQHTTDECGLVQLASRTVGAPFVGAAAAAIVIGEVLRRLHDGVPLEVIDLTLRDPASRSVVPDRTSNRRFNPGFTE